MAERLTLPMIGISDVLCTKGKTAVVRLQMYSYVQMIKI